MRPPQIAPAGPFARSIREALEGAVSPAAANDILAAALAHASLDAVPEVLESFQTFCAGPFRTALRAMVSRAALEPVFERIGHVLWMATGDEQMIEAARAWSRGTGETALPDRDDASGVRHVEPERRRTPPPLPLARAASATPMAPRSDAPWPATSGLERMRAPAVVRSTDPRGALPTSGRVTPLRPTALRSAGWSVPPTYATPLPSNAPLPPMPTPVRSISLVPTRPRASQPPNAPTAVLVLTLDTDLITDIRDELAGWCPVCGIGNPGELSAAIRTAGDRPVVVLDSSLPSISAPTFAGLAPILPVGSRVVLWGAAPQHLERLSVIFPSAKSWVASDGASGAGAFVLDLP